MVAFTVLVICGSTVKLVVIILSQPTDCKHVSMYVPLVLWTLPHTVILPPKHTLIFCVAVLYGAKVVIVVITLSQPLAAVTVFVVVPTCAGSHVVAFTVLELLGNSVVIVVIKLSQPLAAVTVFVVVPTCAGSHVVAFTVLELLGNSVVIVVIKLSQPLEAVTVFVVVPT